MLKDLIKLANHLDAKGLYKEADLLDKVALLTMTMGPYGFSDDSERALDEMRGRIIDNAPKRLADYYSGMDKFDAMEELGEEFWFTDPYDNVTKELNAQPWIDAAYDPDLEEALLTELANFARAKAKAEGITPDEAVAEMGKHEDYITEDYADAIQDLIAGVKPSFNLNYDEINNLEQLRYLSPRARLTKK